jgi:actin-related protein
MDRIEMTFRKIFISKLLCAPKDRRVVVVESIVETRAVREAVVKVLLERLQCAAVLLVQAPYVSILPAMGADRDATGIVVLVGYAQTSVLPIMNGVAMLAYLSHAQFGVKQLHATFSELANEGAQVGMIQWQRKKASENLMKETSGNGLASSHTFAEKMDDVLGRVCFVRANREVCSLPLRSVRTRINWLHETCVRRVLSALFDVQSCTLAYE